MRRATVVKLLALIVLAAVLTASVAVDATRTVGVKHKGQKWRWTPSTLTIKKGSTVKWKGSGKFPHNVTGPGFRSATKTKLTYSHRFTKAGTYRVVCLVHKAF